MEAVYVKRAIVGGWVIALGAIAIALSLSSITGWAVLIGLGLPPPVILLRMWKLPAPTMSESIRNQIR